MVWDDAVWSRLRPASSGPDLSWQPLALVAAVAIVLVSVGPFWRVVRLGVTLVHELGHAFMGLLCGRRFTGLVLRSDMSGHAVTSGRPSGMGIVLTTWAGYPAPALVAVGMTAAVAHGWAAPLLTVMIVAVVTALPRVRSLLTGAVLVVVLSLLGAGWWWRRDAVQAYAALSVALVLLIGAWRHILAVAGSRDRGSDPAVLARLTSVPRVLWLAVYGVVAAACSYALLVLVGILPWRLVL